MELKAISHHVNLVAWNHLSNVERFSSLCQLGDHFLPTVGMNNIQSNMNGSNLSYYVTLKLLYVFVAYSTHFKSLD